MNPKNAIALLLFIAAANAVSLENVTINGSAYYWTYVNDSNGNPYVLINASSGNAQFSTVETDDITTALSRQNWLKYAFGFGRLAANNTVLGVLTPGMESFNTYAFNDSQGWRTESNKTLNIGPNVAVTMRLKHERNDYDKYVNLTVRYELGNRGYNHLSEIYFFIKIHNITAYNHSNIYRNGTIYSRPLIGSYNFTNVSSFTLTGNSTTPMWAYEFMEEESNVVFIKDGSLWLGFPVGRQLPAYSSFQRTLFAIDSNPCTITCDALDGVVLATDIIDDASEQVPVNRTFRVRWSDLMGTCTYGGDCRFNLQTRAPYGTSTQCYTVNRSTGGAAGSNFVGCNIYDPSSYCSSGNARVDYPVKGTDYYINFTQRGRYSKLTPQEHIVRAFFGETGPSLGCGSKDTGPGKEIIAGFDSKPANITCTFNGVAIANNTLNSIYTTNTSLTNVNVTFNCTFGDPSNLFTGTGLTNDSSLSLNRSGWGAGVNISNLVDEYYGRQGITYLDLNNSYAYRFCATINGTNYSITTGNDFNRTCYTITRFEILPYPLTAKPVDEFYHIPRPEDDTGNYNPFIVVALLLFLSVSLGILGGLNRKRKE